MATIITKKTGMTSDETKLAFASGFVELAKAVQALLSDKNYLTELGRAAAEANALNEREIEARDEAADIVLKSAQVTAQHDDRERVLAAQTLAVAARTKESVDQIESLSRQRHAELTEYERQVSEKHANADVLLEKANAQQVKASEILSDAQRKKDSLDAREADLVRRERDIEHFKNKIAG